MNGILHADHALIIGSCNAGRRACAISSGSLAFSAWISLRLYAESATTGHGQAEAESAARAPSAVNVVNVADAVDTVAAPDTMAAVDATQPAQAALCGHGDFLNRFAQESERRARFVLAIVRMEGASSSTAATALHLWEKLLHMQGENVTLRSGVFRLKEAPRQPHIFRVPQIRTWNTMLKDGYPEAVKQEAMTLLDEMSARGEMNADSGVASIWS